MQKAERKRLAGLAADDYEHPMDRSALTNIKKMHGLAPLIRKFNELALDKVDKIQITGSNIRVSGDTFPEVAEVVKEACAILDLGGVPGMYVQDGIAVQAKTVGTDDPIVVLNSACIDYLSLDELLFVVGREIGHILCQHTLYQQVGAALAGMISSLGHMTLGLSELILAPLEYALLSWVRCSELTADRAGLLACQDLNVANGTMAKMAGLPKKFYERFNVDDLVTQAQEFKDRNLGVLDKLANAISIAAEDHPWIVLRAAELHEWVRSQAYALVLDGPARRSGGTQDGRHCMVCGLLVPPEGAYCPACGTRVRDLRSAVAGK